MSSSQQQQYEFIEEGKISCTLILIILLLHRSLSAGSYILLLRVFRGCTLYFRKCKGLLFVYNKLDDQNQHFSMLFHGDENVHGYSNTPIFLNFITHP